MTVTDPGHWDAIYERTAGREVSWFQDDPEPSRSLLRQACAERGSIVDVGAGASSLVTTLLADGWHEVTLVDISAAALDLAVAQVGDPSRVSTVVTDVLQWQPTAQVDAWHDRAVFHFLTDPHQQSEYAALAARTVRIGGALVLGCFAPDGPEQCSSLPVARHDAASLESIFAAGFALEHSERHEHHTPWQAVQPFTWVILRRR